jgi:trigger factor
MHVTTTPSEKSTVILEIEVPAPDVARAIAEATRRISQRSRIPGFRPGKAPRHMVERMLGQSVVLDEAIEALIDRSYRQALAESPELFIIGQPVVELVTADEGGPLVYKATVPVRPEVAIGDYRNFPFKPEIDAVDDAKVDRVIDELRDQQASLAPVEDRAARKGDWAVIGFTGTRDGVAFDGGTAERMPLIIGEDRLIPGFEDHLVGLRTDEETTFDITFPDDYKEESLRGATVVFAVTLRELREKVLPEVNEEFARSLGDFADVAAMRAEIRQRLERNALDRARHGFADRIIDYAVKNATIDLPDLLVDEEVEVMRDEMRASMIRQGISEEQYLEVAGKTAAELVADLRPGAEERAKTLLVLGRIAELEGATVSDAEIDVEADRARARYADQPKLAAYFDTPRARAAIRSSLRRSRVVERLVDEWLAAHPEHPAIPHVEDAAETPGASALDAGPLDAGPLDAATAADSEPAGEEATA